MNTPRQVFKTLQVFFLAMLTGPTLFLAVALFLRQSGRFVGNLFEAEQMQFIQILGILLSIIAVILAYFLYGKKIKAIDQEGTLMYKLEKLRTATLLKFALLESIATIHGVLFLLSGQQLFLILSIALVGFIVLNRPTLSKVSEVLRLNSEEQNALT